MMMSLLTKIQSNTYNLQHRKSKVFTLYTKKPSLLNFVRLAWFYEMVCYSIDLWLTHNHKIWEMIRSERSYIRMKRSWDPRYHEIQDFIRCKRSWDPRDIEIKDIMRSEISWDLRNNEICEIMRWDMRSWNLRDREVRYDIRFNESEIWYLIYWIWSFSWIVGLTDGQTKGQL